MSCKEKPITDALRKFIYNCLKKGVILVLHAICLVKAQY